jgi:aspartyl-tRNA(Asn)/glutamyl-tRNA(Gln) amidotransferase subunit B
MRLLKPEVEAAPGPAPAIDPAQLARLVALVEAGDLSGTNAKQVLEAHARHGTAVDALVEHLGLRQINDEAALVALVDGVLARHPGPVAELRAGKAQVLGFLVGQVMAASRGRANAAAVRALLERRLAEGA